MRLVVGCWIVTMMGCHWHRAPFPEPFGEGDVYRSNLAIPSNQTFELGGGHDGGLQVRIENVGRASVDVLTTDGAVVPVSRGETVDASFGPGEAARVRNATSRGARLKVVYTQQAEGFIPMRYVDLEPEVPSAH